MVVKTPILLMGFNRPEVMAVTFERIREVQPQQLFIAIDGPRMNRVGEASQVEECRRFANMVDWPCDVRTLFQDENLGCGLGVSTAITWFFEHVTEGIILEDDIVPDVSFFDFCAELLERYRDDTRVFAVSGCNYVPQSALTMPHDPYRFSRVPHIWGWATWRRSWREHALDISDWHARLPLKQLWTDVGNSIPATLYWASTFELLGRGHVDTWDGQLVLAAMAKGQFTATSNINLVENIGFGADATHTVEDRNELQPIGSAVLPLVEVALTVDNQADAWTRRHHFRATWRGMAGQAARYLRARQRRLL